MLADAGSWSNGHIDVLRERGIVPRSSRPTRRARPRKTRLGGLYDFMRRVIASERGGALYSQRQWMVEPVLAQIKANRRSTGQLRQSRRGQAIVFGRASHLSLALGNCRRTRVVFVSDPIESITPDELRLVHSRSTPTPPGVRVADQIPVPFAFARIGASDGESDSTPFP